MNVKPIAVSIVLLTLAAVAGFGQTTTPAVAPTFADNWVGAGINYNQYAAPSINGLAAYAHKVIGTDHPTYSFTAVDFLSAKSKPFTVSTVMETGIAQHVIAFGPFEVFGLAMAGVATTASTGGSTVGAAFSGGGMAMARLGKGWTIGPHFRIIKPNPSDTQYAVGLILGWGK